MTRSHYKATICDKRTGEVVCEICFDTVGSNELKILASFCSNRYFIADIRFVWVD